MLGRERYRVESIESEISDPFSFILPKEKVGSIPLVACRDRGITHTNSDAVRELMLLPHISSFFLFSRESLPFVGLVGVSDSLFPFSHVTKFLSQQQQHPLLLLSRMTRLDCLLSPLTQSLAISFFFSPNLVPVTQEARKHNNLSTVLSLT